MKVVWVSAQMKHGEQSTAGTSIGNTSLIMLQSVVYGSDDKILDGIWKSSFCVNSYAFSCKFLDYFCDRELMVSWYLVALVTGESKEKFWLQAMLEQMGFPI